MNMYVEHKNGAACLTKYTQYTMLNLHRVGTIRACTYEIIYIDKKQARNIDAVLTVCRRTVNLLFPFWFQN